MKLKDIKSNPLNEGTSQRTSFPNGYGASIVKHRFSYGGKIGLYELAVLKDDSICYTTPIAEDVLGHLKEDEVNELLKQIEALPHS